MMKKKKRKYQIPELTVKLLPSPMLLEGSTTGEGKDMPWGNAKQSPIYFEDMDIEDMDLEDKEEYYE